MKNSTKVISLALLPIITSAMHWAGPEEWRKAYALTFLPNGEPFMQCRALGFQLLAMYQITSGEAEGLPEGLTPPSQKSIAAKLMSKTKKPKELKPDAAKGKKSGADKGKKFRLKKQSKGAAKLVSSSSGEPEDDHMQLHGGEPNTEVVSRLVTNRKIVTTLTPTEQTRVANFILSHAHESMRTVNMDVLPELARKCMTMFPAAKAAVSVVVNTLNVGAAMFYVLTRSKYISVPQTQIIKHIGIKWHNLMTLTRYFYAMKGWAAECRKSSGAFNFDVIPLRAAYAFDITPKEALSAIVEGITHHQTKEDGLVINSSCENLLVHNPGPHRDAELKTAIALLAPHPQDPNDFDNVSKYLSRVQTSFQTKWAMKSAVSESELAKHADFHKDRLAIVVNVLEAQKIDPEGVLGLAYGSSYIVVGSYRNLPNEYKGIPGGSYLLAYHPGRKSLRYYEIDHFKQQTSSPTDSTSSHSPGWLSYDEQALLATALKNQLGFVVGQSDPGTKQIDEAMA